MSDEGAGVNLLLYSAIPRESLNYTAPILALR